MTINPKIESKLLTHNLDVDTALLYLLSIYFNINSQALPLDVIQNVNLTKIVIVDHRTNSIKWNIPLFLEQTITEIPIEKWEWVEKLRLKFGSTKPGGGGSKNASLLKMKKFFAENPEVRKEDIEKAVDLYLHEFKSGKSSLQYFQRFDYFISKLVNGTVESRLEVYLDILKNNTEVQTKQSTSHISKLVN